MLEHKTTKQPDAVETLFGQPFEKLPVHEMSQDTTEILVSLMLGKKMSLEDSPIPEKENPFIYGVLEKSLKYRFDFKITDARLIIFLCQITRTAGMGIMYLAYLQYWCKKNNTREIDLDIFGERIFPMGFPSEDDLHKLWDATKVNRGNDGGSDNLLDYATAYQSIFFTKLERPEEKKEQPVPTKKESKKPVRGTFVYSKGFSIINGIRREAKQKQSKWL